MASPPLLITVAYDSHNKHFDSLIDLVGLRSVSSSEDFNKVSE